MASYCVQYVWLCNPHKYTPTAQERKRKIKSAIPVVIQLCVSGLWVRISVIYIVTCIWILRRKVQSSEQECCSSHYKTAILSFHRYNPKTQELKERLAKKDRNAVSFWRNSSLYGIRPVKYFYFIFSTIYMCSLNFEGTILTLRLLRCEENTHIILY